MFVHGPSRICTHASSIPIETFAFVLTGGKTRGFEKGTGVGVGVGVPIEVEVFGAPSNRTLIAARAAASISASKALVLISIDHESLLTEEVHQSLSYQRKSESQPRCSCRLRRDRPHRVCWPWWD